LQCQHEEREDASSHDIDTKSIDSPRQPRTEMDREGGGGGKR